MKFVGVVVVLILSGVVANEELWKTFKQNHGKQYRGLLEDKVRYAIFQDNLRKIEEHNKKYNAGEVKYKMAVNQFADMTHDEFVSRLNMHSKPILQVDGIYEASSSPVSAATAIDWRSLGAVTEIKDQGQCGASWSFSATGALEGQLHRAVSELYSLSEQALIDCSSDYGNSGCDGGSMIGAFDYVRLYGIPSEESYPFAGANQECRNYTKLVQTISGYIQVKQDDEDSLSSAINNFGPISVAVDATGFQFYAGGLFTDSDCSSTEVNHGVLAVGYDTDEDGQDYWIIKNSWGLNWGENGYIKMTRGTNQCGVAHEASYPLLYC